MLGGQGGDQAVDGGPGSVDVIFDVQLFTQLLHGGNINLVCDCGQILGLDFFIELRSLKGYKIHFDIFAHLPELAVQHLAAFNDDDGLASAGASPHDGVEQPGLRHQLEELRLLLGRHRSRLSSYFP